MPNLPRYVDARAGRPKRLWPEDERRPAVRRVVYTNRPRAESPTPDHSCQGPVPDGLRRRQLGDDLVAVAAVDRVAELEGAAARIAGPAAAGESGGGAPPLESRLVRSKRKAGECSGTSSAADSSSLVTVGSIVCVAVAISTPYRARRSS